MLFTTRAVADEAVASSSFWPFFFFEETSAHLEGLKPGHEQGWLLRG